MKPAKLIVLGVAAAAAAGTAFLAFNLANRPPAEATVEIQKLPTAQVLVASERIPMGEPLGTEKLKWQEWPESGLGEEFITQAGQPKAIEELSKSIARSSFFVGEPIRQQKLVQSDSGYMSAIVASGKRAVGVQVDAVSSAGGFILPNDHVDVILSRTGTENSGSEFLSETLLTNIRVLAIDQLIEEQEDGSKSVVGDTATLELTPEQTETMAIASLAATRGGGRLSLALRSVEDSRDGAQGGSGARQKVSSTVRIIKFGKNLEVRSKN